MPIIPQSSAKCTNIFRFFLIFFAQCKTAGKLHFPYNEKASPGTLPKTSSDSGPAGFEPADAGIKTLCLTAWRWPRIRRLAPTSENAAAFSDR